MVVKENKPGHCSRCHRKLKATFVVGTLTFGPICVKRLGLDNKVERVISTKSVKDQSKPKRVYDDLTKWLSI